MTKEITDRDQVVIQSNIYKYLMLAALKQSILLSLLRCFWMELHLEFPVICPS